MTNRSALVTSEADQQWLPTILSEKVIGVTFGLTRKDTLVTDVPMGVGHRFAVTDLASHSTPWLSPQSFALMTNWAGHLPLVTCELRGHDARQDSSGCR